MHCAAVQARPPVFLRLHTPQDPDSLIKGHDPGLNILTSPAFPSLPPALKLPSCCSLPSRLEQQLRNFRAGGRDGEGPPPLAQGAASATHPTKHTAPPRPPPPSRSNTCCCWENTMPEASLPFLVSLTLAPPLALLGVSSIDQLCR